MFGQAQSAMLTAEESLIDSLRLRLTDWVQGELVWYAGSFTIHLLGLSALLLLGNMVSAPRPDDVPEIVSVLPEKPTDEPPVFLPIERGAPDEDPPPELVIDPTNLTLSKVAKKEDYIDENPVYKPSSGDKVADSRETRDFGGSDFNIVATGPGAKVKRWGELIGDPRYNAPIGNPHFTERGQGHQHQQSGTGITKPVDRAVNAALIWLARHQSPDGSWSLQNYRHKCTDRTCSEPGSIVADSAATSLGLLPFLAAGFTHKSPGHYRSQVSAGINWLIAHQKPDGDLTCGFNMYAHSLATITLCEDYGMSMDRKVGMAAQGAVNYIMRAQNRSTGGWRYKPGEEGDTSVVGWQVMALKSAEMAGIKFDKSAFAGADRWLNTARGSSEGQYCYVPGQPATPAMSSVGLLCRQYLGTKQTDRLMVEGVRHLMANQPDAAAQNVYYWYYATQVMHNLMDSDWDTWNQKMRKILVESQCHDVKSCSNGSWDPSRDAWGKPGGRLMMTSLATLTLEVYYRFLPLYKTDGKPGGNETTIPLENEI